MALSEYQQAPVGFYVNRLITLVFHGIKLTCQQDWVLHSWNERHNYIDKLKWNKRMTDAACSRNS